MDSTDKNRQFRNFCRNFVAKTASKPYAAGVCPSGIFAGIRGLDDDESDPIPPDRVADTTPSPPFPRRPRNGRGLTKSKEVSTVPCVITPPSHRHGVFYGVKGQYVGKCQSCTWPGLTPDRTDNCYPMAFRGTPWGKTASWVCSRCPLITPIHHPPKNYAG